MSVLHYIKTKRKFDFETLITAVTNEFEAVMFEQRSEEVYYCWLYGVSTRGVDLSMEPDGYLELRNTILASEADYHLTNLLADVVCQLFDGRLFVANENYDEDANLQEEEYLPTDYPLFEEEKMEQDFLDNVQTLEQMTALEGKVFTIFGPIRKVHFGPRYFQEIAHKTEEEKAEHVKKTMLLVNYQFEDYSYGNVMEMGDDDNRITVKLLTNQADCLIDRYDFLTFADTDDGAIMITNATLNTILPKTWNLLDECTVVAPILPENEFLDLVKRAKERNQLAEFEIRMEEK